MAARESLSISLQPSDLQTDSIPPKASRTPLADRIGRLRIQQQEGQGVQSTKVGDALYYGPVPHPSEATGALGARIAQTAREMSQAVDDAATASLPWGRQNIAFGDTLPVEYPDLRMKYQRPVKTKQLVEAPALPDTVGLSTLQQYVIDYIRRHKGAKPTTQPSTQTPILKKHVLGTDEEPLLVQDVGILPDGSIAAQQIIPWDGEESALLRAEWRYNETEETAYWWETSHEHESILPKDASFMQWGPYQQEGESEELPTHEESALQPRATLLNGVLTYGTTLEAISDQFQLDEPLSPAASSSAAENIKYIAGEVLSAVESAAWSIRREVVLTVLDVVDSARALAHVTNRVLRRSVYRPFVNPVARTGNRSLSRYLYKPLVDRLIPADIPLAKGVEATVDLNDLAAAEDLWEVSKLKGFGPRGRNPF